MTRLFMSSSADCSSAWKAARSAAFSATRAVVRAPSSISIHNSNALTSMRYRSLMTICRTRIIVHRYNHHADQAFVTSMFFRRRNDLVVTARTRRQVRHRADQASSTCARRRCWSRPYADCCIMRNATFSIAYPCHEDHALPMRMFAI
eukprot:COSAG06_NODE_23999_length_675_cov_1.559028_2_plen_147_part_01